MAGWGKSLLLRLLAFLGQQIDGSAKTALTLKETLGEAVDQTEDGEQVVDPAAAVLCLRLVGIGAERFGSKALLALPERVQNRIDLAAFPLGGDESEHFPDVVEGLVVIPA